MPKEAEDFETWCRKHTYCNMPTNELTDAEMELVLLCMVDAGIMEVVKDSNPTRYKLTQKWLEGK